MVKLRGNAERLLKEGDRDAQLVLDELNFGKPSDERIN